MTIQQAAKDMEAKINAELSEPTIQELAERYPYIVQWERMIKSFTYYMDAQLREAWKTDAPREAIYERQDGEWVTVNEVEDQEKQDMLRRLVGDPLTPRKNRKHRRQRKARLVVANTVLGNGHTIEIASFNVKGDANLAAQAMADYTKRPHGVLHKGSLTWFAPGA